MRPARERPHAASVPFEHSHQIAFSELATAPLIVDAIYRGGHHKNVRDDPISKLVPGAGNQGGFRQVGGFEFGKCRVLVIYSSGEEVDWPDTLDLERGTLTYYGDNRKPGHELHDTRRKGNALLRDMFGALRGKLTDRRMIPPVLVFSKTGAGRTIRFRGLAVPGEEGIPAEESLVALWRQSEGSRFQNYRAVFSILDAREVSRSWIDGVTRGQADEFDIDAPSAWKDWRDRGRFRVLRAPAEVKWRDQRAQEPTDIQGWELLDALRRRVGDDPTVFEYLAVAIFRLSEPRITAEVTRPVVDGGRDAVGQLSIGGELVGGINIDFALEAKAYGRKNSVGTKEISRLISRLRHRQFGVLVTTSYVARQAYTELSADRHPVVVISGGDIVRLLRQHALGEPVRLNKWMEDVLKDAL